MVLIQIALWTLEQYRQALFKERPGKVKRCHVAQIHTYADVRGKKENSTTKSGIQTTKEECNSSRKILKESRKKMQSARNEQFN